jgi:hypothetical protein
MRGLLGRASLPPDEALLLRGSRSIHTFGMRFAISVAWLDADAHVIEAGRLRPGRLALPRRRARDVLECAEGAGPEIGERLTIVGPAVRSPGPSRRGEGTTAGTTEYQREERAVSTSACRRHRHARSSLEPRGVTRSTVHPSVP